MKPFPGRELFPETSPGQRFLFSGNLSQEENLSHKQNLSQSPFLGKDLSAQYIYPGRRFLCPGNLSQPDIFLPKIPFSARGFSAKETFPSNLSWAEISLPKKPSQAKDFSAQVTFSSQRFLWISAVISLFVLHSESRYYYDDCFTLLYIYKA